MRHVVRAEGDTVYTDLDFKAFEALDVFSDYPNRSRESDPRDNSDLSPTASQAASRGLLLGSDTPLPPGWIADVTMKAVALRVSKGQVKQLESQA